MTDSVKTFDDLCLSQVAITAEIRKILSDYHKTAKKYRNSSLVSNKLQKLEELWTSFEETEEVIQKHENFDETHSYFKESCYDKTEDWYNLTKATLSDRLKSISIHTDNQENPFYIPSPKNSQKHAINPKQPTQTDDETEDYTNTTRFRLQGDKQKSLLHIIQSINQNTLDTASRVFLEQKLQTLNKYWDSFENTHNEIVTHASTTDSESDYFKNNVYITTETSYMDTIIALQEQLESRFPDVTNNTQRTQIHYHNTSPQNQTNFSLAEARSLIPEFNGNPKDLHKFITSCDDAYTTASTAQERNSLLSLIRSKLSAEAYDVFRYNQISNWPDLKLILKQNFEVKTPRSTVQSQLANSRQRMGESVKDFLQRLHITLSKLNEATNSYTSDKLLLHSLLKDNENQAVKAIEDGLSNTQLQTLAKVHTDKSFSALKSHILEHALRLEYRQANNQTNNRINPNFNRSNINQNLRCYKCNKLGHAASKCSEQQPFTPNNNSFQRFNPQLQKPLNIRNSPTPSQLSTCRYCHRVGHSIEECRTRAINNARSQSIDKNQSNGRREEATALPQVANGQPRNRNFQQSNIREGQNPPRPNNANISAITPLSTEPNNTTPPNVNQGNVIQRGVTFGNPSQIQTTAQVHQKPKAISTTN